MHRSPCQEPDCDNLAEVGRDICYKHRVSSIGFTLRGGAIRGSNGFHQTKNDWLRENFEVHSEKELVKTRKDIDRA